MNPNVEVGARRNFFTDGQFLTISCEITYARFAMAKNRERERKRKLKFLREKLGFFLDFFTFSLLNVFLTKIIYPQRKPLLDEHFVQQKIFSKDTLMYVKNLLRMTFH